MIAPQARHRSTAVYFDTFGSDSRIPILELYRKVTIAMPSASGMLWRDYGILAHALGEHSEALVAIQRACVLSPQDATSWSALEDVRRDTVDRWHFRMLNDRDRNVAYHNAIRVAVRFCRMTRARQRDESTKRQRIRARQHDDGIYEDDVVRVLDVGAGTGLLCAFAADAGADIAVGCEMHDILCQIGNDCLNASGFDLNACKIICKHSTQVQRQDLITSIPHRTRGCHTVTRDVMRNEHVSLAQREVSSETRGPEVSPAAATGNTQQLPGECVPNGADVIVSELVDTGLLGERILPVLRDARARLLRQGWCAIGVSTHEPLVLQ